MTYPRSNHFGKQLSDINVRLLTTLLKVQECNHTRLSDGYQITPEGLETKSSKKYSPPDYANEIYEGMFYFEQYREALYMNHQV